MGVVNLMDDARRPPNRESGSYAADAATTTSCHVAKAESQGTSVIAGEGGRTLRPAQQLYSLAS